MIIGTVRPEEARVFDSEAGYHQFHNEAGESYGSFEVFWKDATKDSDEDMPAGWYWHACFPGCMPDGEPSGPFANSRDAMYDADEYHPDNVEDPECSDCGGVRGIGGGFCGACGGELPKPE